MEIRPARPADGPRILELIRSLAEFEKLPAPDQAAGDRLLADAFERRLVEFWVAELGGAVVAYAACFTSYSTFRARPTLFLEDLFVHPSGRRRGVATAMLARLRQEAERRGCGRFEWMVLDWNEPALRFYEGLGGERLDTWRLHRKTLLP
jgi:GNAT superfamily N-acetyltransferase